MSNTALVFVPFPRNPSFVAREADLRTLAEQLQRNRVVSIYAPGGIGKTALALEYAYSSRYPCVFWLNASTRESLLADYYALSHYLHLPLQAEPQSAHERPAAVDAQTEQHTSDEQHLPDKQGQKPRTQDQPVPTLPDWLVRVRQYLLVLDDLQNPELLQKVLSASLAGHILITTRQRDLALPQPAASFELARLDLQNSALLLQKLSGQTFPAQTQDQTMLASHAAFISLARDLSGQLLALTLAGNHIKTSGISFARFYQDYQAALAEVPAFQERPDGFSRGFATLIPLVLSSLQQRNTRAYEILGICAFLAPNAIPTSLFASTAANTAIPGDAPQELDLAYLCASGFLNDSHTTQTFSIHPLLQQAIQSMLPLEQQHRLVTQALHLLFQAGPGGKNDRSGRLRVLAHIYQCATLGEPWSFVSAEIARTFAWAAAALEEHTSLEAALFLRNKALTIWERVPTTKRAALISLRQKQILLAQRMENHAEAEAQLHQVIPECISCYGVDHPITILQLTRLARTYLARQSREEAEVCYKKAFSLSQRGRHASDQLVIAIQHELAMFYVRTSDFSSAEFLLQGVYNAFKQQIGASHPETLKHALELALCCMMTHKWSEAEALLQSVRLAYEHDSATPPTEALRIWHYLALTFTAQAKWDAANTTYQRILERIVETQGRLHPDLLPYLNEISYLYQAQKGRQAEKQAMQAWSQEIREHQLAHPQNGSPLLLLDNLSILGTLYLGQKRYSEAEQLFMRFLLLSDHWQIRDPRLLAVNLSALTVTQIAQGQTRIPQATLSMQAALNAWQHAFGPDHPAVVTLKNQYHQWIQEHPGEGHLSPRSIL